MKTFGASDFISAGSRERVSRDHPSWRRLAMVPEASDKIRPCSFDPGIGGWFLIIQERGYQLRKSSVLWAVVVCGNLMMLLGKTQLCKSSSGRGAHAPTPALPLLLQHALRPLHETPPDPSRPDPLHLTRGNGIPPSSGLHCPPCLLTGRG